MASFLTFFDIFGTGFQFSTFKKEKFKTKVGGIMTILCLLTITIFAYFFGRDFFFRLNPTVLTQQVFPDNYSDPFILDQQNMPFIWRLSDTYSRTVNHAGIFYPRFTHYSYVNNSTGSVLIKQTILDVTKCSTDLIKDPILLNKVNIDDWYCIDWRNKNLSFGGYWDGNYVDYFSMEIWVCPGGTFSNENCSDLNTVKEFINTYEGVYIDMFYPEIYFVPTDVENPLKVNYKNYFFKFNLEIRKLDRLFIEKVELLDDLGWIIRTPESKIMYSSNELKTDFYFFNEKDWGKANIDATFYSMMIYYDKQYTLFNRSYMKFQDMLAIVGGFTDLILIVGAILSNFYNIYIRDELLYNELFEFRPVINETDSLKCENLRINKSILSLDKKYYSTNILVTNNNENLEINQDISQEKPKIPDKKLNLNLGLNNKDKEVKFDDINHVAGDFFRRIENKKMTITKDRNSMISLNNVFKLNNTKNSKKDPKINNIKQNSIKFGIRFTLAKKFLGSCYKSTNKENIYQFLKRYVNERLDVTFYLKTLEKFDRVRVLLFNYYQNLLLNFTKIPNLSNKQELLNLDLDLNKNEPISHEELANYFNFRIKNNELDEYDEQLLKIIVPEIRNLVLKKD